MKILKIGVLASTMALAGVTTAFAGGFAAPVVEVAPVAQETTWDGWYAGAGLGRGQESATFKGTDVSARENFVDAFGGYRRDLGNVVVGGEASLTHADNFDAIGVAAIAGYDAGKFLPYVSVGATRFDDSNVTDTVPTLGLGVDYAVADNMTVGVKYTNSYVGETYLGGDYGVDRIESVAVRAAYRF